jgi:hypothetical protein
VRPNQWAVGVESVEPGGEAGERWPNRSSTDGDRLAGIGWAVDYLAFIAQ